MPAVGDSSRQAGRGEASDVLLAQFRRQQCAPSFRRQPTRARPWNGAQGHDLRSDKTASPPPLSQPHNPIRRTLLPAHALTPVTPETSNTQLVFDFCRGGLAPQPTFCHVRSVLIYCIPCPQYFRGATKPVLILKLPVCISAALPPSCSLLYRVHCCAPLCALLCALVRAKCPQCPIPGLPLSHNAAGHFYAHFYIYLLVCRVHDVFPVFVGEENIEPAIDWNKVQVSVKLELKSLPKGIQADLKMEKLRLLSVFFEQVEIDQH